jgi:hypothetical protein
MISARLAKSGVVLIVVAIAVSIAANPETFTVEDARSKVYGLKGMGGDAIGRDLPRPERAAGEAGQNRCRDHRGADRVDADVGSQGGRRDAVPAGKLGKHRQPSAPLHRLEAGPEDRGRNHRGDIQALSDDIVADRHGGKPSVSNARHMRKAASGMFRWALRREYITANPCSDPEPLDPEHPRTRVLSEDEIRIFWHGLDREDLMTS